MQIKFDIGDTVWYHNSDVFEEWVDCPCCGGTKKIHFILWNGEEGDLACDECNRSWDGPLGKIKKNRHENYVSHGEIIGLDIDPNEVRYKVSYTACSSSWRNLYEYEIFSTLAEAEEALNARVKGRQKIDEERYKEKARPRAKWAANLSYYRQRIKDLERDLAYANKQLQWAKTKVKEKTDA